MLQFSYDEDNIYQLKVSESYEIESYQDQNVIRLKNINKDNIQQQFILTPEHVEGIPLQRYQHYDFLNASNPNIVSLLSHELWDGLTNFKIMFIKNVKDENNYYLFQDFLNNDDIIINSSEGSGVIEIIQKMYVTQRDKNYQLVTISQKDLLQEYGLPISSISFRKDGEEQWVNSIFYDIINRNNSKCFYVKLNLKKLDIDGIFRDLVIRCTQTTV